MIQQPLRKLHKYICSKHYRLIIVEIQNYSSNSEKGRKKQNLKE